MSQMQNNLDEIKNISSPSWQIEQIMIFLNFFFPLLRLVELDGQNLKSHFA